MNRHQEKELRHSFEVFALLMELDSRPWDAYWFRRQAEGLIEGFRTTDAHCPGYVESVLRQYRGQLWVLSDGQSNSDATSE